jgi:hypothetical protein
MVALSRRTLLKTTAAGAIGSLAGCTGLLDRSPPAGSLRFENNDNLPHAIRVEVTGVGAEPGDGPGEVTGDVTVTPVQRNLTAAATLEPGDSETYESVFTEPIWYGIQFTLDGEIPENDSGTTVFNPVETAGETWNILSGTVYESGELSWVISSTKNSGRFDG